MAAKSAILDPTLTKRGTVLDMKIRHNLPENYVNRTRNVFFGIFFLLFAKQNGRQIRHLGSDFDQIGTLLNMTIRHKIPENYDNSFINVTSIVKKWFLTGEIIFRYHHT